MSSMVEPGKYVPTLLHFSGFNTFHAFAGNPKFSCDLKAYPPKKLIKHEYRIIKFSVDVLLVFYLQLK